MSGGILLLVCSLVPLFDMFLKGDVGGASKVKEPVSSKAHVQPRLSGSRGQCCFCAPAPSLPGFPETFPPPHLASVCLFVWRFLFLRLLNRMLLSVWHLIIIGLCKSFLFLFFFLYFQTPSHFPFPHRYSSICLDYVCSLEKLKHCFVCI